MPIKRCTFKKKPGYKWGDEGKCYTYTPGDKTSRDQAKRLASRQGLAIGEEATVKKIVTSGGNPVSANLAKLITIKDGKQIAERGKPITEVKGSVDNFINQVWRDFREQFRDDPFDDGWYPWIAETFIDHVIARESSLRLGEFWMVGFSESDGKFVFIDRNDWVKVELAYQISGEMTESKKFREVLTAAVTLEEGTGTKARFISGTGITADVVNANGRRYPYAVLKRAVDNAISHLKESTGQGRLAILGEADHPSDKGNPRPQFLETIVNWTELGLDAGTKQVAIRGQILETRKGQDAIAIMTGGVMPGISIRGYGVTRTVEDTMTGRSILEVVEMTITGFDLLVPGEQSDPNGGIDVIEGKKEKSNTAQPEEANDMNPEEVLALLQESGMMDQVGDLVLQKITEAKAEAEEGQRMGLLREALSVDKDADIVGAVSALIENVNRDPEAEEAALRERLGVDAGDDLGSTLEERMVRLQKLEEAAVAREVELFIESTIAALKYPDWMKTQLTEAVVGEKPETVEAAKALIESRRREYSGFVSKMELAARGHRNGLEVLGPVIERNAGVPAYAVAAHELLEAYHRHNTGIVAVQRNLAAPGNINELFAAEYLRRFDEKYKHHLVQEARMLQEAEQTSDLSLPYSVSRAIIAEAIPMLIATSIYDVGMTDSSEQRVYYETYAGESGEQVAVLAEDFTSDEDAWVQLDFKRIIPNATISVEPDGGGTPWVEGTDYVIDYGNGRIWTLSTGGIGDATATEIDYDYKAFRKGEMAAIERGKGTLSYTTLSMLADRLATEVSTEAALFSRSQIGWDATARTLAMLVREISQKIDQDLMYLALAGALITASNSGGSWVASTDTLDELVQYIGYAKVKVVNRYYSPDHILLSATNADILSNWDGFTAAGQRADGALNPNGLIGRLKGLPVFQSTEFSDSYILVANREIVHHRVFQPMILKGPYPSFSSNKLIPSEQYYAEEFNGSDSPVPEKAAYVKIS